MNGLPKAQDDARVPIGCEPCLFHANFVSTDSKLLCPKETLRISADTAGLIRQRVVQRNFRAGNDGAGGVAHNALKSRSNSGRLSMCTDRAKQKHSRCRKLDSNTTQREQMAI